MIARAYQLSAARRFGGASLLSLVALLVFALGERAAIGLQFDRGAIQAGQWFRLLTGHFTHFGGDHLLWDLLMFFVLGCACESRDRLRFLMTVIASAFLVALSVYLLIPELQTYRGLSGIDSALFTLLAALMLRDAVEKRRRGIMAIVAIFLAAFLAKIIIEIVSGRAIFVDSASSGFAAVPLAHLVGACTGALAALVPVKRPEPRARTEGVRCDA